MRIVDNSTVEFDVTFTEPVKSVDGTALTDLDYSTVYITTPAGTIKSTQIQESAPTGGGIRSTKVLVNAPSGAKTTVSFSATSTDTSGNESPQSNVVTITVDRIGPAAPTNFTAA